MPKPIIDDYKLNCLVRQGKTQRQIAQILGVTDGAISRARKRLSVSVAKNVALESAHKVVESNLDAVAQLWRINERANSLLDTATKSDDHETALKCMTEIRGQLRLQLEIFSVLYDVKEIQAFQQEVLNLIEEAEPGARARILQRLKEKRAIRSAIDVR